MPDNLIVSTPEAYAYPLLVKQLLTNSLSLYGDQEITYRGELRYTYRDFRRRLGQLASALEGLGVRHGATVAVMDWDSHRYLESYFAIPMMGATLFTVNVRLAPHQIAYALNDSEAEIVLVHADFVPVLEDIKGELTSVREVVVLADGQAVPANTLPVAGEYEALVGQASPDFEFGDFDENTKAATFYTSGTTGDPKGVYYSHRQIVLHTMATAMALCAPRAGQRIHREDVYMPITPMFHVLAWGFPFIAVTLGLKTVLPGRYLPEVLLKLKQSEKVTVSHCVPTILRMLLQAADASKQDLAGWTMIIGGAAFPPALCRAAREKGIDVFAGSGMSETGPVVTLAQIPPGVTPADADDDVRRRSLTGRPVPFVDLRVVDEGMCDVPRDGKTQGEIVLRSPFLTQGYFKNPRASEELWAGGWLHTPGRRGHVSGRLGADRRPHQGRHQDRRRVGVVDRGRVADRRRAGGTGSRGHRCEGRDVGRAADGVRRRQARREGRRGRGPRPPAGPGRVQPHQQVRGARARPHRLRPRDPENERRQDQQEAAARAQHLTHSGADLALAPFRPWRSPSCTNCEPAATNIETRPGSHALRHAHPLKK